MNTTSDMVKQKYADIMLIRVNDANTTSGVVAQQCSTRVNGMNTTSDMGIQQC